MLMPLQLSILDFDFPGHAVEISAAAERLGYRRLWLGEHHAEEQCNNPLLLGALLAASSRGLRLGSGGVCMSYQSPTRIAEDARLVEYLVPDRFDLGVTRGLSNQAAWQQAALLDGRPPAATADFDARVRELHALLTRRLPPAHPMFGLPPSAMGVGPPLWVLALSQGSARLAAELGAGFCYSLHHASWRADGPDVVAAYHRHFKPSPEFQEPRALLAVSGICAATTTAATAAFERLRAETATPILERVDPGKLLIGSPEHWGERLPDIAARHGAGEVLVLDLLTGRLSERLEMYSLLAERFRLPGRGGGANRPGRRAQPVSGSEGPPAARRIAPRSRRGELARQFRR